VDSHDVSQRHICLDWAGVLFNPSIPGLT
jgi:hypothetical protein